MCAACLGGGKTDCTKCSSGFLLSGGECKTKCMENCAVCTSASTCSECKPTHFVGTNGTCVECSTKFHDCATCTKDKCLTYLCQHNDPQCNLKKTPGQYFSETTQKCEKCSDGCDECEFDHFKGSKCTLCKNGLFLTSEGECIPCHYVEGCVTSQCDGNKCLECQRGYHRSGKGCKRCPEGCGKCDDNGKCISCSYGFILDKEYGKCVDSYEDENCLTKDGQGLCNKCKPGYGLNRYQRCMQCDASCKQCTYVEKCDVCKDTFYNVMVTVNHAQREDVTFVMLKNVSAVNQMHSFIMEFVLEVHLDVHYAMIKHQFAEYVKKV